MNYTTIVGALHRALLKAESEVPVEPKHLASILRQVFVAEVGDLPLISTSGKFVRVGAVEVKWLEESGRWSPRKNDRWYEGEELADLLVRQLPPTTTAPPPNVFVKGTRSRMLEKLSSVGQAFSDYRGLLACLLDVAIAARHLRNLLEGGTKPPGTELLKAQILKPRKRLQKGLKGEPPATRAVSGALKRPEDITAAMEQLDEALLRLDAHACSMDL